MDELNWATFRRTVDLWVTPVDNTKWSQQLPMLLFIVLDDWSLKKLDSLFILIHYYYPNPCVCVCVFHNSQQSAPWWDPETKYCVWHPHPTPTTESWTPAAGRTLGKFHRGARTPSSAVSMWHSVRAAVSACLICYLYNFEPDGGLQRSLFWWFDFSKNSRDSRMWAAGVCGSLTAQREEFVLPWSSRHAFVPGSLTLSHLVHPCAAVKAVSSAHKTCGGVDPSNDAEPCKEQKVVRCSTRKIFVVRT